MVKCKLGDILDVKRGASLSGKYYSEKGNMVRLTLGNFNYPNGGFKENTSKTDIFFTGEVKKEFILKKGDIITPLTEQVEGLLGETARIPESNKYIQSGDIALIIPDEKKLNKSFAYYLISSPHIKKQLGAAAQQTKIRHTSPDKIKACETWIPDLNYQEKAANILDTINSKINNNNRINNEIQLMSKMIYDYWFLQFDFPNKNGNPYKSSGGKMIYNDILKRKIPEGWKVIKLLDIAYLYQPQIISDKDLVSDGKYFVYGAGGIFGKHNKFNHKEREIIISCRGNCGQVRMTLPESWINGNAMVVHPKEKFPYKEYLYHTLNRIGVEKCITGSVQRQITRTNLENYYILVPDKYLLENFESIFNKYRNLLEKNYCENEELKSLRDFLLPLLINGQVKF